MWIFDDLDDFSCLGDFFIVDFSLNCNFYDLQWFTGLCSEVAVEGVIVET